MLIGAGENINCIDLQFFLKMESEEEGVGFLFLRGKSQHVTHCNYEKGDQKGTPHHKKGTNNSAKNSLRINVSIASRG